jgi:aryl-phospho-beta-D-glucosidase BglC (GH1 family)
LTNPVRKSIDRATIYNLILIIILFSLPLVTAQLAKNSTINISTSGTIGSIVARPLHVEGRYIKDDLGNTIYLRGVGRWAFYYTPTGWFMSGSMWEDNVWDESLVRFQLQTIKSWGMNHIRFHTVGDWWKQDTVTYKGYTGSYRNNLRRVIEIAGEEGLYVIVNHYSPISYQTEANHGSGIPYAPYSYNGESGSSVAMANVFPNKQAFVDYWANGVDGVADVLGDLPNVIFEIQNEPHALGTDALGYDPVLVRDDFMDAQQQCITAIRNITNSQNLIMVTWGVGMVPSGGLNIFDSDMSWAYTYSNKLVDPLNRLVYVGHLYRRPFHTTWSLDNNTLRTQFENIFVKQVSQEHPVIFGEMGVSMAYAGAFLDEELTWARNTLEICNEWGIGYSAWVWEPMPYVDQDWWLYEDLTNIVPTAWGQVLIAAIAEGGTMVPA